MESKDAKDDKHTIKHTTDEIVIQVLCGTELK
jgi:hypothetical protein